MQVKAYIVQKKDGEVVAVKLTFMAAHQTAKEHAPAKVLFGIANKEPGRNVVEYEGDQSGEINCTERLSP